MSKRLFFVLLTAALAAATLVGFTVPATPASAEQRTVTVRLADGSLTTVTVDVPPGTPLDQIQIPPPPATPTVPVPVPVPTLPGSPAPPPGDGGNPDQGQPSDQQPSDSAPNASDKSKAQNKSGDKQKAKPNALGDAPNAEPQREVKKKLDKINEQ